MICRFLAVILAFALFGAVGCRTVSSEEERGPKFSDYPVTQMFGGIPAAPKIVRPEERAASSIIQEGSRKADGSLVPTGKPKGQVQTSPATTLSSSGVEALTTGKRLSLTPSQDRSSNRPWRARAANTLAIFPFQWTHWILRL